MMRWMVAAMMLTAPGAVIAQEREQFDLLCKGQERVLPSRRWKSTEVRYRVDLAARMWCNFACTTIRPLVIVDPTQIVFEFSGRESELSPYIEHNVNRTNGRWRYYNTADSETEGVCQIEPFSGLPSARF